MMRTSLLLVLVVAACGKNEQPPAPSSGVNTGQETGPGARRPASGEPTEADRIFMTTCATCHGTDGSGNGPAAASLEPKPRNYSDAAWQASITDDEIKNIIVQGGQALGKSPMMPANPQLKGQDETLNGLVKIIRGFGPAK